MAVTPHRALLWLYAETPVHAGGDAGLGALDLPIQREVTTGYPIIKGESLKGALREHTRPLLDAGLWKTVFGAEPPTPGNPERSLTPGSIRVHEAQILAFPTPTLIDTFKWVTSPMVRARLARRAALTGVPIPAPARGGPEPDDTVCQVAGRNDQKNAVLGSYRIDARARKDLQEWAAVIAYLALPGGEEHEFFRTKLGRDLYLVSDELLTAISRECTSVVARVQLGAEIDGQPTKTVKHGPFYSEYLPAETLLVAMVETRQASHLDELSRVLDNQVVQVGGDETIGKGLMWCRVTPGAERAQ
jgi:CRISPR-associated protein Cmr4